MRKNLSKLLNMREFEQEQAKRLVLKTMEDSKKFEKYSQEDMKKISCLKGETAKRDQKIAVKLEEIKACRKLSKISTVDQMAKEVAKGDLAMQEKQSIKKRRYEAPKKVRAMRQVDFQDSEEEEQGNSRERESSGEEELMRRIVKLKKKSKRAIKESKISTEESSSDEDKKPAKVKHKKKNKVSDYI